MAASLINTTVDDAPATPYTTTSAVYGGDKLYILSTTTRASAGGATPAFTSVAFTTGGTTTGTWQRGNYINIATTIRPEWWWCLPNVDATDTLTLTTDGATWGALGYAVDSFIAGEFDPYNPFVHGHENDGDTSNDVATGSSTSGSATLAQTQTSGNILWAMVTHNANEAANPRVNWTELSDYSAGVTSPLLSLETQVRTSGTDTVATSTWTTAATYRIVAAEIRSPAGLPAPSNGQWFV